MGDIVVKTVKPAPGVDAYNKLIEGGFSADEANAWRAQETQKLQQGGFSAAEIADYWGNTEPNMKSLQAHTDANLAKADPKVAKNPLEMLAAGWDMSVTSLATRGMPKTVRPQDSGLMGEIMYGIGMFAGDIPATVTGFVGGGSAGVAGGGAAGGAIGSAVPVVGTVAGAGVGATVGGLAGAGFGSAALPEAMREVLLDRYEHQDGPFTWSDFMARSGKIAYNSAKAGVVGSAGMLVGGPVGSKVLGATARPLVAGVAEATSAAAAMTATGAAMEGKVPEAKDFVAAATMALGFHVAGTAVKVGKPVVDRVAQNMRDYYRKTGTTPSDQMAMAKTDKSFWQQLNSRTPDGEVLPSANRPSEPEPYFEQGNTDTLPIELPKSPEKGVLYRGQPVGREPGEQPFLTPDRRVAEMYAGKDGVVDVHENGFTNLLEAKNWMEAKAKLGIPASATMPELAAAAKAAGHDGVTFKTSNGQEFIRLNNASAPKRTQIIDELSPEDWLDIVRPLEGSGDAAISPKGAVGRYQIMPDTAIQYGFDPAKLKDPEYNAKVAQAVLSDLTRRFRKPDGSVDKEAVLIAYNAGPGRAAKFIRDGRDFKGLPAETQRYLEHAERIGAFEEPPAGGAGGKPPGGDEPPKMIEGPNGPEPMKLSPEMLADKISDVFAEPKRQSPMEWIREQKRRFTFDAISELMPAERIDAARGVPKTELGIADAFRQVYGAAGRAYHRLYFGGTQFDIPDGKAGFYKDNAPPLMSIYDSAKEKGSVAELKAVRQAARTLELAERGIKTPTSIEDATALMKSPLGEKYRAELDIARKANDAKIDDYAASGMMSKEAAAKMKANNRDWFPQIPEKEAALANKRGPRFGALSILKRIKGHENMIQDPAVQEIKSFYSMAAMADKNRATGALVNALSKEEQAAIGLKAIPDKTTKIEIFDKDGNLIPEAVDKMLEPMKVGDREFVHFENGVGKHYEVDDPQLAQMIAGISPIKPDQALGILRWFATLKRSGITDMPDFIARAMAKDTVGAAIMSKWGGVPFVNTVRGLFYLSKADPVFQRFVANGGLGASLSDMDAKWVQRDLHRMQRDAGFFSGTINVVSHPLEAAQLLMQKMDSATRLGIFMKAEKSGLSPLKAGTEARRGTLDFQEKSASQTLQLLANIVPFYRPSVLGLKQIKEAFTERPVETGIKSLVYIAAPTVALYVMNYLADESLPENEKFANLPRWQKDTMFVLPPVAGVRVRIPMPPILGTMVGGLTNRVLDSFVQEDPEAFKKWGNTFLAQFIPPVVPAAILPIYEHMANYNSFQDRPLIPTMLEDASGYEQFLPNTSETAKSVARLLGPPKLNLVDVSPIVIDNYVRQWTGGLGSAVLKLLDASGRVMELLPDGAPKEWADNPFIGSFFARTPNMSAQPIADFYDKLDEVKRANKDLALAISRNDVADIDFTSKKAQAFLKVTQITDALNQQRQAIAAIAANKDMTQDEKRQYIGDLASGMIQVAKGGKAVLDAVK